MLPVVLCNQRVGAFVLENPIRVAAWIHECVAGTIGNPEGTRRLRPPTLLEVANRAAQVLHDEEQHARTGGTMIRYEDEGTLTEAKRRHVGTEPLKVPYELRTQRVAVIGQVALKIRGAHVEILEETKGRRHAACIALALEEPRPGAPSQPA